MNNKKEEIEEIENKLHEINEVISEYVPEIRWEAFEILAPYFGIVRLPKKTIVEKRVKKAEKVEEISTEENKTVLSQKPHKRRGKHLNNPVKVFKYIYDKDGESPVSRKDIEQEGRKLGVDVGPRSDRFLMDKRDKDSHKLFIREGKGYIPTHYGKIYLKGISGIIESTEPLPSELKE